MPDLSFLPKAAKGFLDSEFPLADPREAFFHILPAPYEKTVSFGGGTAWGPQAIIEASRQLEALCGQSTPGELGIFTREAIDCSGKDEEALALIKAAVHAALACRGLPVILGGEHTVTLGALRALKAHYGEFGIVQFDAHADLRDQYDGSSLSHACVMRRAVQDLGLPLAQIAVRDFCREEVEARKKFNVIHHDAAHMAEFGLPEKPLPETFPRRIYISFDVDALDCALMPATGTPSPGGLFWYEALLLARRAVSGREVIGFDVVEFAPISGLHSADFTAARLVYNLMALVQSNLGISSKSVSQGNTA